ncbi:MAG: N-acetylmuramoyl-L-alanine amidase [Bacteroidaceae bacterium]|nr:N-acetylmuramoyl-L-alanine amidase [Bacteroidaceae bacterium]MBQ9560600.1 N-acetylmuramoyl-L-alanine amidase [Bacteroidaceae bacterium]
MSRQIKYIFVHCTAGSQRQTVADLQAEFRRIGWKNPGYHYVIFPDGRVVQLQDEARVANGVRGYNKEAIHVAYVGGIDAEGKAVDNRTNMQRHRLIMILKILHKRYPTARILGHRDISPDKNHNGKVDRWERIKECPCFDAITEYQDI